MTVGDAAALWGVNRHTVYHWITTGIVTCFRPAPDGELAAPLRDIILAKVFLARQLEPRGVSRSAIEFAVSSGTVGPMSERYSLADLEVIRLTTEIPRRGDARSERKRRHSGIICKAIVDLQAQERAWVERGADVRRLPNAHFDTLGPPEVIPPADVFSYRPGEGVPGQPDKRFVQRSAGYSCVEGQLIWFAADDHYATIDAFEPLKREWVESSHLHRLAQQRSDAEWWRRNRYRFGTR